MAGKYSGYKTQSVIFVLIILGFVAVANYLGTKKFARVDLTESKQYSISPATKNMLRGLLLQAAERAVSRARGESIVGSHNYV